MLGTCLLGLLVPPAGARILWVGCALSGPIPVALGACVPGEREVALGSELCSEWQTYGSVSQE